MTLVDTICHMATWFTMVYYDIDWVDLAHKICWIFGIHLCSEEQDTWEKHVKIELPIWKKLWSLILMPNSTALKLREKMWSLDAAFDPQISPSFFIFLHPPHLFKALQGRPLDEVVGVHRLPPAVDTNGQKIQWIIYEWYVNICEYHEFRWFQNSSDTFWH